MEAAIVSDSLAIALNITNNSPGQYLNMPFTSVVSFNGETLFFGPTGIFEEGGDDDNGTDIDAWIDTPNHDFGRREQKSVEAFDVGYEAAGDLTLTLHGDEDTTYARTFTLEPVRPGQVQQDGMKTLKKYRYGRKRYWKVRVANVDGCDFSLDFLALAVVVYKRGAK